MERLRSLSGTVVIGNTIGRWADEHVYLSLQSGERVKVSIPDSLREGLEVGMSVSMDVDANGRVHAWRPA
jgi:hypothetical protein